MRFIHRAGGWSSMRALSHAESAMSIPTYRWVPQGFEPAAKHGRHLPPARGDALAVLLAGETPPGVPVVVLTGAPAVLLLT